MYSDVPLIVSVAMIGLGLWLLTWGANRFVDASAALVIALILVIGLLLCLFGRHPIISSYP